MEAFAAGSVSDAHLLCFADEFSKIREEIPPPIVDAHLKTVEEARKEGVTVDANFGLEKTGIAGTAPETEEAETKPGWL